MMSYLRKKVIDPVQSYLSQGLEPETLARSSAVGFAIGICPIVGVTGLICAVAILADRRLHAAMTLLANYCAMPVEIPLIIPFMRLGEWVTRAHPIDLNPKQLWHDLKADPALVLPGVGCAVLGWLLLAIPVAIASFYAALHLIKKIKPKSDNQSQMETEELLHTDSESEMTPLRPHDAQD